MDDKKKKSKMLKSKRTTASTPKKVTVTKKTVKPAKKTTVKATTTPKTKAKTDYYKKAKAIVGGPGVKLAEPGTKMRAMQKAEAKRKASQSGATGKNKPSSLNREYRTMKKMRQLEKAGTGSNFKTTTNVKKKYKKPGMPTF